jgi:hypothetical protein
MGPVQLAVLVPEDAGVVYSDPAYAGFWKPDVATPFPEPLISLPVSITREARAIPQHNPVYRGGKNWAMWEDGDHLILCSGFHEQPVARFYCRLDRELSSASLCLDPAREGSDSEPFEAPVRYPMDQILSWGLLARCGGFIMHAAVAVKDGVGWVFAGRSGAGKSTLSGLCHAEGWRILNDDRVMVFLREGELRVAGTPWHGSGRFAEAAEVPLGGVYFLHQANEDRVAALSPKETRMALLDVGAIPWFVDAWSEKALAWVDALARHDVFHRFYFTRSAQAVRALAAHAGQFVEVGP